MDITGLAAVLNNGPNKTSAGKKDVLKAAANFETILQEFEKESAKDLKEIGQNLNVVLLQLLALINMGQLPDEKANGAVSDDVNNLQNQLLVQNTVRLLDNGEINSLWKDLVTRFFSEGRLNEKIAAKFFEALKSCSPEMAKVDINSFLEQLKKLLNQKADSIKAANENESSIVQKKSVEVEQTGGYNLAPMKKSEKFQIDIEASAAKRDNKTKEMDMKKEQNQIKEWVSKTGKSYSEVIPAQKSFKNTLNIDFPVLERYSNEVLPESKPTGLNEKVLLSQETRPFPIKTLEQIVDKIQLALKGGRSELSLKLKPEHLGNVMVKIFSDGNKLRAELFIENAYIHEALQYHAQELKNQIQQHGYNLTEVNIYQTSDWQAGNFNGREFEKNFEFHHSRKTRYNLKDEEQVKEITSLKYLNGLENTVSVNYVV